MPLLQAPHRTSSRTLVIAWAATTILLLAASPRALHAWTPSAHGAIAEQAARLAPRDLWRQIEKHHHEFERGLLAPFQDSDTMLHQVNGDGTGLLDQALTMEVKRTIAYIQQHRPMKDIVFQAGVVMHYANDLHNPLNCSAADRLEGDYYADFLDYMDSARPRVPVVFYGLDSMLENGRLEDFVAKVGARCRDSYTLVGKEYRRIGKLPGRRYFDDRSTAFAIASLSYSRAISDAALLLRYLWLEAGGGDFRSTPHSSEGRLLVIPPTQP